MPDSDAMKEFKSSLEIIGTSHTELKRLIDKQADEIKKNGEATAETKSQMDKVNARLQEGLDLKKKVEDLEVAFKRGGGSDADSEKKSKELEKEIKSAEQAYLRKDDKSGIRALVEKKALSVNSDPDGGYLVTPDLTGRTQTRIYESSPIRQVATVIQISTDAIEGMVDLDEAGAEWTAETVAATNQKTPQFGKYRIPVHELSTRPRITQKLLEDANFDPAAWLAAKVSDKFSRTENASFVNGNGAARPRGFLTYPNGTGPNTAWQTVEQVNLGSAATLNADGLINLMYSLKDPYRSNARWAFNRMTHAKVRQLKDTQGRYYWQPSFEMGQPPQLLGAGIVEMNDLPDVAANALAVMWADWSQFYTIVDRIGLSVLVDPYTVKPYTEYYTRKRVGGDVTNFEAGKIGKIAV